MYNCSQEVVHKPINMQTPMITKAFWAKVNKIKLRKNLYTKPSVFLRVQDNTRCNSDLLLENVVKLNWMNILLHFYKPKRSILSNKKIKRQSASTDI